MATPHLLDLVNSRRGLLVVAWGLMLAFHPPAALGFLEEEANTIAVYDQVAPSVVNITTQACEPDFALCAVPGTATGSGIILTEDGIIVTNHHVVAHAERIQISLDDGRQFAARLIGSAPEQDVAVLQVDAGTGRLKPLTLGDSDAVQVGDKVLAVGNPFGLGQTLTVGAVSMVGRDIRNGNQILRGLIQTDAAINPGNSGGALVNSRGQLVGMSTVILSPTGSNIGIGFAIPANRIKRVTPGIIHGWGRLLGWAIAIILVGWIIRRIYSPRWERSGGRREA